MNQIDTLILADGPLGKELGNRLAEGQYESHGDAYDALMAMGRRRWSTIILTAPRADFAGLCRATRRLQEKSRIFSLCPPAGEMDVKPLSPSVIDDYFIYPPTRADIAKLRRTVRESAPRQDAPSDENQGQFTPDDVASLIDACRSLAILESSIADIASRCAGTPVRWMDQPAAPDGMEVLLSYENDRRRRVLVQTGGESLQKSDMQFLPQIEGYLQSLVTLAQRSQSLHHLAITDHLTGAYNRRYFYHLTDQILLRAGKRNLQATLLLFDIDDFKHYNDTYGHASGDEILKAIASLMKGVVRSRDVVARIGGDEFATLFWDAGRQVLADAKPPQSAQVLADRFRQAVESHAFTCLGSEATGSLTISGGLAVFPRDGTTCRELLARADEALKASKVSGKNSITLIGQ